MQDLSNKNAIITGGTRGIGFATAKALAEEGVNIAIVGRNPETLVESIGELKKTGVTVIGASGDISNPDDVEQLIKEIEETFDRVDILINNAGIMQHGPFLDSKFEDFEQMMNINVFGMYHMLKRVLPKMTGQNQGDVVNIASVSGLRSSKNSSLYAATKFAVIGMTEGLLQEMRPHNIRMSYLTPSAVMTDLIGEQKLEEESMTHPEDIADIVVNNLKINPRTFVKNAEMWATNPIPKE